MAATGAELIVASIVHGPEGDGITAMGTSRTLNSQPEAAMRTHKWMGRRE